MIVIALAISAVLISQVAQKIPWCGRFIEPYM
jgi:hypothetical protein